MRRYFVMKIYNFANRCKLWTPKSSKVNLDHETERCLSNHDYHLDWVSSTLSFQKSSKTMKDVRPLTTEWRLTQKYIGIANQPARLQKLSTPPS